MPTLVKRLVAAATSALALVISPCVPVAAAEVSDHVQLTENLIWCYQQQTRVEVGVDLALRFYGSDGRAIAGVLGKISTPSINATTVPRSWYIDAIKAGALSRDATVLRAIYEACQAHNDRAMEYLRGEDDRNLVRAARYTVACKPESVDGATPNWCSAFLAADEGTGGGYEMAWPPG